MKTSEIEKFIRKYQYDFNCLKYENIKIFTNACDCNLCKGLNAPNKMPGWKAVKSGGRYPVEIQYNPNVYDCVWSSKDYEPSKKYDEQSIIARIKASFHGCWKLLKNEEILVIRKK